MDEMDGVAVIGMQGRFPGAGDIDELWTRLRSGDDMVTDYSEAELRDAGTPEDLLRDPAFVPAGAPLCDAYDFDHEFFGYTRREGELLDPQHRLALETAWRLLETTGYAGRGGTAIGVFAGTSMNTYMHNVVAREVDLLTAEGTELLLTNDKDYLAPRLSYKLGLTGPSVTVQTACSSSLSAIHLAVQSLLAGECDLALAGGVSVLANPHPGYLHREAMILSRDGRTRAFDADASGTVFGDGVGLVALKRLPDALDDGDTVIAVVKGSALNNDGAAKVGFAAPSVEGQRAVIAEALAVAGIDAAAVSYVEAHGTATALGDQVELAALSEVFGAAPRETPCLLGTVKANFGHLAAAAGVAGFIKAVLALHHGEVPPHPHFRRPGEGLADGVFQINTEPVPWRRIDEVPRRAGVSSFGMGGTNVHVVLEEAPDVPPRRSERARWELVTVSARDEAALEELCGSLANCLDPGNAGQVRRPGEGHDLSDVAFSLAAGRRAHPYRYAVTAADSRAAAEALRSVGRRQIAGPAHTPGRTVLIIGDGPFAGLGDAAAFGPIRETLRGCSDILTGLGVELDGLLPAEARLADLVSRLAIGSLLTGSGWEPDEILGDENIAAHLRGTAGLAETMRRMIAGPATATVGWEGVKADGVVVIGDVSAPAPDAVVIGSRSEPGASRSEQLLRVAGRLWTAGVPLEWASWRPGRPRRVPLPAHPLRRERLAIAGPKRRRRPERDAAPARWLYTEAWQRTVPAPSEPEPAARWLLFEDSGGVGSGVATELTRLGHEVMRVRAGQVFGRSAPDAFTVDPDTPGSVGALFAALAAEGRLPGRVVHFWTLDGDSADKAASVPCQARGFHGVLDVVAQASQHAVPDARTAITVVTTGVHQVLGGESVNAAASMVDVAVLVARQEFPKLSVRTLDIDESDQARGLVDELLGRTAHRALALRGGGRWVKRYVPLVDSAPLVPARAGGVHLISGGLGRVGLALAEKLAAFGDTRLILTRRSPFPDPREYDDWLGDHGPDDPVSRVIERIRRMESLGAQVYAVSADVADERRMRAVVAEAEHRFGPIGAWFHAASVRPVTASCLIGGADRADWRRIFTPKVQGALVLRRIFAGRIPGVLISSLSSVLGGVGYAAYGAANAFLDALARADDTLTSIAWEAWAFDDDPGAVSATRKELAGLALTADEGAEAFGRILRQAGSSSVVYVSAEDLDARVRRWSPPPPDPAGSAAAPTPPLEGDDLKRALARLWSEELRSEIDSYDANLFDLGGDSLLAVELAMRIGEELGEKLTADDLLGAPSIEQLAAFLRGGASGALAEVVDERVRRRTHGRAGLRGRTD
ncbi:SDR family NAD(P)-dependent oxidoreductase [Nonomuraea basaltis]|uniref:SDR family NAD(P)-dependent oxidoreductase n=1 Tax=Nonomuraea basaltis TaxID=2495887 RepID=UPI00148731F4|nr:SDR family NAD(P)-dependent oxidoreductase [Nonomuraea basaltis]